MEEGHVFITSLVSLSLLMCDLLWVTIIFFEYHSMKNEHYFMGTMFQVVVCDLVSHWERM